MGLIQTAIGSAKSVLADQWKEYFYCEALPANVLAVKGKKRATGRSNNRGADNIISNGSVIAVADGQCMIIVEQGKIVEVCAEPGEFTFDSSTEPSIFAGGLNEKGIMDSILNIGKRFTFGGEIAKDQRIYYFNTKEILGNKYGTPGSIPFRVIDANINLDIDISVKCFGEYSYRITNPLLFYTNVCGNVNAAYTREMIDSQLKSELLTALQPAFARISEMGIRYSQVPGHTTEVSEALNEVLSSKWRDKRGIEIVSFGISSMKASEEDEKMIKELQRNATLRDPSMAAAHLAGARASAMQNAAQNAGGAAIGFMGMNMAAGGGMNEQALFQMAQQNQQAQMAQQAAADSWQCSCGSMATGKFCAECGGKKPAPKIEVVGGWQCSCGNTVSGKFCPECGARKPEEEAGWTCSCGAVNQGKFCAECGAKKPAGAPQYKCDKCGWVPADPTNPPKFCPECGDPFGDEDIVQEP